MENEKTRRDFLRRSAGLTTLVLTPPFFYSSFSDAQESFSAFHKMYELEGSLGLWGIQGSFDVKVNENAYQAALKLKFNEENENFYQIHTRGALQGYSLLPAQTVVKRDLDFLAAKMFGRGYQDENQLTFTYDGDKLAQIHAQGIKERVVFPSSDDIPLDFLSATLALMINYYQGTIIEKITLINHEGALMESKITTEKRGLETLFEMPLNDEFFDKMKFALNKDYEPIEASFKGSIVSASLQVKKDLDKNKKSDRFIKQLHPHKK